MPSSDTTRRGFLAGGNFIIDTVKTIDTWPAQDTLAWISETRRSNGGGPYNLLKNLARLDPDMPRAAIALVGHDAEGTWLLDDCRAAGIDISQLHRSAAVTTSITDVMTAADTGRRTFFHAPGASTALAPGHFDFSTTRARILYLGYLGLLEKLDHLDGRGSTPAAGLLQKARAAGLVTCVDCVSAPNPRFREIATASLRHADYFLANEIEAGWILGREITATNAAEATRELGTLGDTATVVLHLATAAFACPPGGEPLRQPSVDFPADKIAGTNGAGDAFATGFLHAVHHDLPLDTALRHGVCVAARSLTAPTPSDGIAPLADCLKLGTLHGFLA